MSTVLTPEQRAIFKSGAATVTFQDHGQDFLRFHIKDRRVIGCEPCQASVWCGLEVTCFPEVGKQLGVRREDGREMFIKYPIQKVEPLRTEVSAKRKLYVIEVSGPFRPCWYCAPSDEDDNTELHTTADEDMASKWEHFQSANAVMRGLVRSFRAREFRINTIEVQG